MSKGPDNSLNFGHFDWAAISAKSEIESVAFRVMALDVLDMPELVKVLSDSVSDWTWECDLMNLFKSKLFDITGLENNVEAHAKAMAAPPKQGACRVHPQPIALSVYLETHAECSFDIINLNWTGIWSEERKRDLRKLFAGRPRLNVGGFLILTMALNRDQPQTKDELLHFADNSQAFVFYGNPDRASSDSSFHVRGIPEWVITQADDAGLKLRPLMAGVFYSQSSGTNRHLAPMVQFLFKRID